MPPRRAASRRVTEVVRAASGRPTPNSRTANPTPPPESAPSDLAAILAEVRKMGERQEVFQRQTQAAITALQQDNAALQQENTRLRGAAPQAAASQFSDMPPTPQQPVASLVRHITGERPSPVMRVDLFVDPKLKQRVWAHEAIDLALLLKGGEGDTAYDVTITKSQEGPSLRISDAPQRSSNLTESKWIKAWNIFSSIYLQVFPECGQGLAVHFQQVQQLMQERGDWRSYDRSFRRAVQEGLQQWGQMNPTLYVSARLKFVHSAQAVPQQRDGTAPAAVNVGGKKVQPPRGYCFGYHLKAKCHTKKCRYKHACFQCNAGEHPAINCDAVQKQEQSFPAENRKGGASAKN